MPLISSGVPRYRRYLGVDPGASGGIAVVTVNRKNRLVDVQAFAMPTTELGILEVLLNIITDDRFKGSDIKVVIEQVSGYIGEKQPGSRAFKFGQSYGALRMALYAVGLDPITKIPRTWQSHLHLPPRKKKGAGKESKAMFKNRLKEMAIELFPGMKVTLKTADALLIAHYCRLIHTESIVAA
jgi:hypothetical protein